MRMAGGLYPGCVPMHSQPLHNFLLGEPRFDLCIVFLCGDACHNPSIACVKVVNFVSFLHVPQKLDHVGTPFCQVFMYHNTVCPLTSLLEFCLVNFLSIILIMKFHKDSFLISQPVTSSNSALKFDFKAVEFSSNRIPMRWSQKMISNVHYTNQFGLSKWNYSVK